VTVGEVIRTPEERAMGLLFKLGHSLTSRDKIEAGGATIVGTGTTFGPDGVTFDGNGNLSYAVSGAKISRSTLTIKLDLTFAVPAGGLCYILDSVGNNITVHRRADNALWIMAGGALVLNIAYATWSAQLVVGKNKLVISLISGSNAIWLNGISIGTSVTTWALKPSSTVLSIGSSHTNTSRFVGTIHAVEIYGNTSTAVDEPYLRQGTLISALDDPLAVLPGTSYYKNDAGLFVTDVGGRIGGTALMGSDGATAAQFPSIIRPRGFSFDGGDQINLGNDDRYSFTDGVTDKPFSVACIVQQNVGAKCLIMGKATASNNGEYILGAILAGGLVRIYFLQIDETAVAWISRYAVLGVNGLSRGRVIAATSSGSGTAAGMRIYADGVRVDTNDSPSGVYARMRSTVRPLLVGGGNAGYTALNGTETLSVIDDKEWSPLQVKALTARLLRLARTP